jgi:hypothetical protein
VAAGPHRRALRGASADARRVDPFVNPTGTTGLTYYRLHGITGSRHAYADDELLRLRDALSLAGGTYVMFKNIPRADDARGLGRLLGEGLVCDLPAYAVRTSGRSRCPGELVSVTFGGRCEPAAERACDREGASDLRSHLDEWASHTLY